MISRVSCLTLLLYLLLPAHAQHLPALTNRDALFNSSSSQANLSPGQLLPAVLLLKGTPPALQPPPAARTRLLGSLANPDVAVLLLGIGTLLIFAECNLPGAILPGATGLLLLLSGVFALTLVPVRPAALLILVVASATLALSARTPAYGIPALLGTTGLVYSFATLVAKPPSLTPAVHPVVAITVGTAVGISASLLGRIAWQARRNKTVPPSDPKLTHADHPIADVPPSSRADRYIPAAPSQRRP